jgi:hypothetical protein
MAFEECATIMCITRENGSLMLQTGQRVESVTDAGSFILERKVSAIPQPGKAIWWWPACAQRQFTKDLDSEALGRGTPCRDFTLVPASSAAVAVTPKGSSSAADAPG